MTFSFLCCKYQHTWLFVLMHLVYTLDSDETGFWAYCLAKCSDNSSIGLSAFGDTIEEVYRDIALSAQQFGRLNSCEVTFTVERKSSSPSPSSSPTDSPSFSTSVSVLG